MSGQPQSDTPRTHSSRGQVTRGALVAAARVVFERDGFSDARITDITATARVATGSFYTYFADKHEALMAVVDTVREEMVPSAFPDRDRAAARDPVAVIEAANRAYLDGYRRNARLMGLVEHVSMTDPAYLDKRIARARLIEARNADSIRRLQHLGQADPTLDADLAATALSGLVSRLAYRAFVAGDDVPFEQIVATTTRLWANAIGLGERKGEG